MKNDNPKQKDIVIASAKMTHLNSSQLQIQARIVRLSSVKTAGAINMIPNIFIIPPILSTIPNKEKRAKK
jgi:hypothetical protein